MKRAKPAARNGGRLTRKGAPIPYTKKMTSNPHIAADPTAQGHPGQRWVSCAVARLAKTPRPSHHSKTPTSHAGRDRGSTAPRVLDGGSGTPGLVRDTPPS